MKDQDYSFKNILQKASLFNKLGMDLAKQSKWEEAIKEYEKSLALYPGYAEVYINLGKAYENLGKMDLAIENWLKALSVDPSGASSHYTKDVLQERVPQAENEKESKESVLDSDPPEINHNRALELFNQGMEHFQIREFEVAISKWEEALEIYPEFNEVHLNLGTAFKEINRFDRAKYHYLRSIELEPEDYLSHYNLGLLYYQEKSYEHACEEYKKAIAIKPDDISSIYNLGMAYFYLKKFKEGEKEFKRVLDLDSSYGLAYYSLGLIYDEEDRLNSAASNYQKAILFLPDHAPSHYELGVVYFKKRNFEFALSEWKKVLELEPQNYQFVHGDMGIIYEELKMDDRAWKEYELAVKYNPSDVNACFRLGVLMMREGLYEDALFYLTEVIKIEEKGTKVDKAKDYIEVINNTLKKLEEEEEED